MKMAVLKRVKRVERECMADCGIGGPRRVFWEAKTVRVDLPANVIFKISDILFIVKVGRNGQAAFVENAINGDVVEGQLTKDCIGQVILLYSMGIVVKTEARD